MKIKIFQAAEEQDPADLESEINTWLNKLKPSQILGISQSSTYYAKTRISILYLE